MARFEHRQCELRDPMIEPQHYLELNFATSVHSLMIVSFTPILPAAAPRHMSLCTCPFSVVFQGRTPEPERFILSTAGCHIRGEWLDALPLKQVPALGIPS